MTLPFTDTKDFFRWLWAVINKNHWKYGAAYLSYIVMCFFAWPLPAWRYCALLFAFVTFFWCAYRFFRMDIEDKITKAFDDARKESEL